MALNTILLARHCKQTQLLKHHTARPWWPLEQLPELRVQIHFFPLHDLSRPQRSHKPLVATFLALLAKVSTSLVLNPKLHRVLTGPSCFQNEPKCTGWDPGFP